VGEKRVVILLVVVNPLPTLFRENKRAWTGVFGGNRYVSRQFSAVFVIQTTAMTAKSAYQLVMDSTLLLAMIAGASRIPRITCPVLSSARC
jgi:hypothetical protein